MCQVEQLFKADPSRRLLLVEVVLLLTAVKDEGKCSHHVRRPKIEAEISVTPPINAGSFL